MLLFLPHNINCFIFWRWQTMPPVVPPTIICIAKNVELLRLSRFQITVDSEHKLLFLSLRNSVYCQFSYHFPYISQNNQSSDKARCGALENYRRRCGVSAVRVYLARLDAYCATTCWMWMGQLPVNLNASLWKNCTSRRVDSFVYFENCDRKIVEWKWCIRSA